MPFRVVGLVRSSDWEFGIYREPLRERVEVDFHVPCWTAGVLDPPAGNQLLLVRSSVSSWPAPTPRDWGLLSVGGWWCPP